MTNLKTTLIATAFIAFGALSISSLTAKADITGSLAQCRAYTAEKVIRCCDQIIQTQGRPFWMVENHASCQTSVVCTGGKPKGRLSSIAYLPPKKFVCGIQVRFNDGQGTPGKAGNPPRFRGQLG